MSIYLEKESLAARLAISSFAILIATISSRAVGEEGAMVVTPVQVVDSDPEKIKQVLASHPDALAQSNFLASNNPPASYANSAYYSIHTFMFIDTGGTKHAVKWRFIPQDGEKRLADSELATAPKDFLQQRLMERVAKGPVNWNMVVFVGEPGDPEDNATLTWPETRKHFTAGTLTITQATPQPGAACEKINYDPLVMADGIAPTADPVLLFRSPAYAISFAKRLTGR